MKDFSIPKSDYPFSQRKHIYNEKKTFAEWRRHIYGSINGTKGNMVKLKKSTLLTKTEKEILQTAIDAMENLRLEFIKNLIRK